MEKKIEYVADYFVNALNALPEVMEYTEALSRYENDEEVTQLSDKYFSLAQTFQKKQYEGTLTQEEIAELRLVAAKLQNNPLSIELAEKQRELVKVLQECNYEISNIAGMDFCKAGGSVSLLRILFRPYPARNGTGGTFGYSVFVCSINILS